MDLLNLARDLAKKAGEATLEVREKGSVNSILKADGTPYTKGDEVSHDILLDLEIHSGIPVLSEEMDKERYFENQKKYESGRKIWIIDPLDGTKEYAKGLDEFAISVALIHEGKPVIGVVYSPARNLMMYGEKDCGATRIDTRTGLESTLRTSFVNDFDRMKLLVSSSELNQEAYPDYVNNLIRLGYQISDDSRIQALGSTTLKTALIASGDGDYNFTFTAWDWKKNKMRITKEWDIAATYLLVREAGGMMTDCAGNDFIFGNKDPKNYNGIFTSNSRDNHPALLKYVTTGINLEQIKESK